MWSFGFKCLCGKDIHLVCGRSLESKRFIHMKGTKLIRWMSDLNNHLKNLFIQENIISFISEVRKYSGKVKTEKGS